MKNKSFKKKLTLSVSSLTKERSDKIRYAKSQNKNSIIIGKKHIKSGFRKTGQHFNKKQTRQEVRTTKISGKDPALFNRNFVEPLSFDLITAL